MAPINKPYGQKPHAKAPPAKPKTKTPSTPAKGAKPKPAPVGPYGLSPDTSLDAPLTNQQAYGMAQASADRQYAPQIQQVQKLHDSAPQWYADAVARIGQAQEAQQQYAQPVLDQAAGWANAAPSLPPGMDPNSPEAAAALQASKSGQGLAQLGADTLVAIPTANQGYLSGQASIASRELPQLQAGYGQQLGQLGSAREQAATEAYGTIRGNEQNASIARQTLGLNAVNTAADNAQNAADSAQAVKDKRAARVVSRKNTRDRITAAGVKTQATADKQAAKDKATADKATAKHKTDIQKATGAVQTKVTDARDAWERYAKARNPKTTLDPTTGNPVPVMDPKTKKPVMIGATPDQIKARLRKDGYTETEIHIMLQLRGKKKLTPADVKRLKDQDQNIRIPREWLPDKPKEDTSNYARPNRPAPPKGYQDRPT